MSRNFDIARSRLRNGWCEFSARLLSHLPQVWADAFGPRRCSARVRSTQRSETPARPPAHAGTLARARRTWFYTCSGRAASHPGEAVSSGHRAANPRKTGPVSRSIGILSSRTREHFRPLPSFPACGLREHDARVSLAGTGNFMRFQPRNREKTVASHPGSRD